MVKQMATTTVQSKSTGKGWHGDPAGHARAGRKGGMKSSGNFRNNPERAAAAGRRGGSMSPGNFRNNPERARAAGRKGGSK
jgi:general stress protein YciG